MGGCAEHLDNMAMVARRLKPSQELSKMTADQMEKVARYLRSGLPEAEKTDG